MNHEYTKIMVGQVTVYMKQPQFPEDTMPELTALVQQYKEQDYHQQITASKNWEMMYQFAESRTNLLEWLDFKKNANVLELGAGCGTITGLLLDQGVTLTCQEENLSYCRLNALRHKDVSFQIYADSYENCEYELKDNYDYILCIGLIEQKQADVLLESLYKHLAKDGKLIISAENKLGLKYWAGNQEQVTGKYFAGLEGTCAKKGIRYYTKQGLEALFTKAGYGNVEFYYPYPDQRFPFNLYSDRYLPKKGELSYNIVNYEGDRLLLFDEQKVYDSLIEEQLYPMFANSYLCLVSQNAKSPQPDYIRYASDRARKFAIRTELSVEGKRQGVWKKALYPEGRDHIVHIAKAYEKLQEQYQGTKFRFNDCKLEEDQMSARFLLVQGNSLQSKVEHLIVSHQISEVFELLKELAELIRSLSSDITFTMTEEFRQVFGNEEIYGHLNGQLCSPVTDIDLVLSNILVDEQGVWNVIDYEWTFFFPIPQNFILYRTLFFLHQENQSQEEFSMENLLKFVGIASEEADAYAKMEEYFQQYITGGLTPYREMVNVLGRTYLNVAQIKSEYEQTKEQNEILKSQGLLGAARKIKRAITGHRKR